MPLILPSNSISAGGYEVDNSLRFNSGSSDYLNRTPSSSGNQKTFTVSTWVKRGKITDGDCIFSTGSANTNDFFIHFPAEDDLLVVARYNSSNALYFQTNRLFRDVSAWYHIFVAVDTTQATESNRVKIYINGVQETSFSTETYPSQNQLLRVNESSYTNYIGNLRGSSNYFDGYMSEVVIIDGQQLTPTSFGEFDSATGIWKPIDVSGLTFGTNGFYLDFQDSAALGDDVSGNGNDFTVNNLTAIDQSTDTPTNNFCTLNPLAANSGYAFSDGNLTLGINGVNDEEKMIPATFGASSGKWYWEVKNTSSSDTNYIHAGYGTDEFISNYINGSQSTSNYVANNGYWNGIQGNGDAGTGISIIRAGTGSNYTVSNTFLQNSIAMFAIDLDNRKGWVGLDGTWINDSSGNTGDPSSGANPTWDSNDLISTDKIWLPTMTGYYTQPSCSLNFGSPPFTISSGNSDGNGYGNFEYAVPSGFYALNTKNLAEYG